MLRQLREYIGYGGGHKYENANLEKVTTMDQEMDVDLLAREEEERKMGRKCCEEYEGQLFYLQDMWFTI